MIEREDFASGTSSKSTKLVHGGVRYLEKAGGWAVPCKTGSACPSVDAVAAGTKKKKLTAGAEAAGPRWVQFTCSRSRVS